MRFVALTDDELDLLKERVRKSVSNSKNNKRKDVLESVLQKLNVAPDEKDVFNTIPFSGLFDEAFERAWEK